MKPKYVAFGELGLLALLVALFFWWISPIEVTKVDDEQKASATSSKVAFFPDVEVEAKAAYVYDALTGKSLFEKDPELQWPLASLTKLVSAVTASNIVPEYMLVRITPDDLRQEGDTGLYPDEEWNVRKLIDYSLVVSSNDGMSAIASVAGSHIGGENETPNQIFVDEMNKFAKSIGLSQTYFLNQSGLDVTPALSGGYGSAKDMAILMDYIIKNDPHLLEATSYDRILIPSSTTIHTAQNTNKSIPTIPNVIASKTGFTDLSGGNVVVAWNAGLSHPIIISVLGSSYDGRFVDLNKLVDATLTYLTNASSTVEIPQPANR
jgi:D-alanyl-D-alanine carboxypeptidase (penicillin-binding protein 5/6)